MFIYVILFQTGSRNLSSVSPEIDSKKDLRIYSGPDPLWKWKLPMMRQRAVPRVAGYWHSANKKLGGGT